MERFDSSPRTFLAVLAAALLLVILCLAAPEALAGGRVTDMIHQLPLWLGQGLGGTGNRAPGPTQPVTVYTRGDTHPGELLCLEYRIGSNYAKIDCVYSSSVTNDAGSGFHHSNWHCTIPAQPAGTSVDYQLFAVPSGTCATGTGQNFSGFNWSYSVTSACTGDASDIVITEVMYDQVGSSVTRYANGEWIELYNQGAAGTCVNLDDFRTDDQDNFPYHVFDFPNIRLYAGDYLVVYTGRPTQSSQAGPNDYVADFLFDDGVRPPMPPSADDYAFVLHMNIPGVTIWNDTGDEVLLYVENGGGEGYQSGIDTPVDYVEWKSPNSSRPVGFNWTCLSSNPAATQGQSIALIPGQPSGNCASWEAAGASGASGYTGNGGSTRGPSSIGGPNAAASGLGLVCDSGGSTPVIDGDVDGDEAWDFSGGTRYIPESEHSFPAPSRSSNTGSDYAGESSAATYWSGGTSPVPHTLSNGDADIQHFWATADADNLYLAVSHPCALWTTRYGGSDVVDLFIAIDTDNNTGAGVYQNSPLWSKRVDFWGWDPEYAVAVERIENGNDYAALVQWNGSAWVDVRAGSSFAYGTYWAGDPDDCTLEFRLPWSDLGGAPTNLDVWNFAVYTTHDADDYDVYDSGPGVGITPFFEQLGDYPRDADYPCGISDPVVIAAGGNSDEALCGDNDGANIYQDSDNSYHGDDPLDAGNQPGSDNYGSDDVDTIVVYYAIEFDDATCPAPTPVELASFTAWAYGTDVRVTWETASEVDLLGFNLYRGTAADGPYVQVNGKLIPAQNPGAPYGARYAWWDRGLRLGRTYYYQLEQIDVNGNTTQYGPVAVTLRPRVGPR
ncbi:MAG: lamin tail domain-containing protein [Anaerolineae bacterium]|nr:lamin tail domain-containing protein [Anaerolineae bacterium]